jgi:hypothetical protein
MAFAFTHEIQVAFTENALTFTEQGEMPVTIPYRDHPEVFGHPRFLMADFDKSAALVRMTIKQLKGMRAALIAPKIVIAINRPLSGGVAEIDKATLNQIFTEAGARKVVFKDA